MRTIVDFCIKSGVRYRTLPNISDVMSGIVKVRELRDVNLEDLLKRDEIHLCEEKIGSCIAGKRVLVTGAGGSIGTELCRQIARFSPEEIVLFERAENSLFYIDMALEGLGNKTKVPIIGDICDRKKVREIFSEYRPQIIFHAAAYKHVPLMESNPFEAIKNNVFGTKILAEEAYEFGVEKFVMLSTDKAVNPTSIMGASKRIAEMLITAFSRKNGTKFMAVRFGNVLGSDGSVVPTFKKQIEKKVPVTITHPDIERYFMTIPEAVGLVLEASFIGNGGEIFVLEMGEQIKIVDLARDLIRLSGLEPDKDIDIVFTGLRPGEKMNEELVAADEKAVQTDNKKIMVLESRIETRRDIFEDVELLDGIVENHDINALKEALTRIVTGEQLSFLMDLCSQASL